MVHCNEHRKKPFLIEDDLKVIFKIVVARPDSTLTFEQTDDIYRSFLKDILQISQNTWKVEQYLQMIHSCNDNCDYKIAWDVDSGCTAMNVWQTGTMRDDFEMYGCTLHLDFMKRQIKSYS